MNPQIASNRLWEVINTLEDRSETGYDVMRVREARQALRYLENWILPQDE